MKPRFVIVMLLVFALAVPVQMLAQDSKAAGSTQTEPNEHLTILFVFDGMRPDLINAQNTPTLFQLQKEGVNFTNSHSVFPSVTRAVSAVIATGSHPARNGILGNSMYIPAIDPAHAVNTGSFKNILSLDESRKGHLLLTKTLSERLAEKGLKLAVVSSGTQGSSFVLNSRAKYNVGTLVNGYFRQGELVAFPEKINTAILKRFPPAPNQEKDEELFAERVEWTENVLKDFILPEVKPDVVINWFTEPDHAQHYYDVGSPEAMQMLRRADGAMASVLAKLRELGLYQSTDILVISDHGFSKYVYGVNIDQELINAGLKTGKDSDDVVTVGNEEVAFIHVKGRNREKVRAIVAYLQKQSWADVLFTAPTKMKAAVSGLPTESISQGWVKGTFSLDIVHLWNPDISPDIIVTFPWTSQENRYGYPGTDYQVGSYSGPIKGMKSSHGSISPWTMHSTMIACGPSFKSGVTSSVPVGNIDVVSTIIKLKDLLPDQEIDGRVIAEALKGGVDVEKVPRQTRSYNATSSDGLCQAILQVSIVDGKTYIDKAWRVH
jgi:predicted AlkP superfamily pyrophosphatase or phosphodiesterase